MLNATTRAWPLEPWLPLRLHGGLSEIRSGVRFDMKEAGLFSNIE
jgi:hypothetical protein